MKTKYAYYYPWLSLTSFLAPQTQTYKIASLLPQKGASKVQGRAASGQGNAGKAIFSALDKSETTQRVLTRSCACNLYFKIV